MVKGLRILLGAVIGLELGLAVFACTFTYAPALFPGWEKLPATTSAVTDLGASLGCEGAVCVRTADGSSLQLTRSEPWRWLPGFSCTGGPYRLAELADPCGSSSSVKCTRPGMSPPGIEGAFDKMVALLEQGLPETDVRDGQMPAMVVGPCDLLSGPFSAASYPPAGIRACLESQTGFIDSQFVQAVVLDSKGALWRYCLSWTNTYRVVSGNAFVLRLSMAAVICCPIIGAIVAFSGWSPKETHKGL